jgi:hypothetical protein
VPCTVPKVATRELTSCFDGSSDHEMITDRVVPAAIPDLLRGVRLAAVARSQHRS